MSLLRLVEHAVCLHQNHSIIAHAPDYSPTDVATLLQAGGVELLSAKTLIAPNLEYNASFFYDPATRKLRKQFEIYLEALQANVKFANDLERTHAELLKRIQAERQRNH